MSLAGTDFALDSCDAVDWCSVSTSHESDARRSLRILAVLHQSNPTMSDKDNRSKARRRAGRPPAGAREGEKVKDYPQLSVRVPHEMKARLNALSAVTGLSQWRIVVEAIDCFLSDLPPNDRELVDGLSQRLSGV